MNLFDPSLPSRFWDKVVPVPFSGCWLWIGATTSKGYGSFNLGTENGRQKTGVSHVLTHDLAKTRPEREESRVVVDHKCRVRCCCNPEHLEAVPEPVNIARGISPAALHRVKVACPKGHVYDGLNTLWYRNKRYCKECRSKR